MKKALFWDRFYQTCMLFVILMQTACFAGKPQSSSELIKPDEKQGRLSVNEIPNIQFGSLQCWISSDKQSYELGENVNITAVLKNVGDKTLSVVQRRVSIPYVWSLAVEGVGVSYLPYPGPPFVPLDKKAFKALEPGNEFSMDFPALLDGDGGWRITEAGEYNITMKYGLSETVIEKEWGLDNIWTGEIVSNTVTINVVEKK